MAKTDAVMVSEALQRDFVAPMLKDAFPGWPVETGFELRMEGGLAGVAGVAGVAGWRDGL